jgi:hypothetical protein
MKGVKNLPGRGDDGAAMPRNRKQRSKAPARSPRKSAWVAENTRTLSGVTSDYDSASTRGDFLPQNPPRSSAIRADSPHDTGRLEPPINADEIHEPESEGRKRHVAEFEDTEPHRHGRQSEFDRHAQPPKRRRK